MSRILPLRPETPSQSGEGVKLVGIDDESAEAVFNAIGSETTREILDSIYQKPGTATDIAERTDVSLQNAKYHLNKLLEAELVEIGEVWYSEQGNKMKVYSPTNESVVMVAGDRGTRATIKEMLTQLIGSIGLLGIVSYFVDRFISYKLMAADGSTGSDSGAVDFYSKGNSTVTPTPSGETVHYFSADFIELLTPGVAFFIGGLSILILLITWNLYSNSIT